MQQILVYFFIAIGLSMDAFSLAIAYGTNNLNKSKVILLSTFVGIFHFFMPILGSLIGNNLEQFITKSNMIVGIILLVIAVQMYLSRNEEKKGNITNFLSILLFSFTVSIDSFSVGIGLGITGSSILQAALIFSPVSAIFTFIGLNLGKKLNNQLGNKAIYLGIFILTFLAIKYIFF